MRLFYFSFLAAGLLLVFGGCNIINPSEVVPTYVQIDSFRFSGRQIGTSSHKITNVLVYFDNAPVGNFDLPIRFPVLATQTGKLTVIPGIDYDGLSVYPVNYPLYTADTFTLSPSPGAVIPFKPVTGYSINAASRLEEYFEQGAGLQNSFKDSALLNTTTAGEVFEGHGSGKFHLYPGKDSALVLSDTVSNIISGRDAYIEFDYKGTLILRVGMHSRNKSTGVAYQEQIIGFNPRTTWGKVYVGFKEFIQANPNSEYRVLLRVDKPAGESDGTTLIDNLKVISN